MSKMPSTPTQIMRQTESPLGRVSEIDEEVGRNSNMIDELDKAISALYERLGPVLQNIPTPCAPKSDVTQSRQSQMANMLQARNDRLGMFIDRLNGIRHDLAL